MTTDDLTWTKAKNTLLVGAAGVVVLAALQIMADVSKTRVDVSEIKIAIAGQQAKNEAESRATNERVSKIERYLENHR